LPFWLGEGILINQKMMSGNPSTITNHEIGGWQRGIDSRLPSVKPEASYLNHDLAR